MTTHIWRDGVRIQVECTAQGEPVLFTWQGQTHPVDMLIRQWRAYYRLSTQTGLLVILFQDLTTGEWFLQCLYD